MNIKIRALSKTKNIKISIIDISEAMNEITSLQGTNPLASIALSKFTAANTLLGIEFKNHEKTVSNLATSDGLISKMIAEYQGNKLRAFIQKPNFDISSLSNDRDIFDKVIGINGSLVVVRDLDMKDPYVSRTDLINSSIDDNFSHFFKVSNQVNSFVLTHAALDDNLMIKKVFGILVQLLPGHTDDDIALLELKFGNTKHLLDVLNKTTNYESLIKEIIEDAVILEQTQLKFECSCSKEKVLNAINLLGEQELSEIIAKKETIETICEFCKKKWNVDWRELIKE